MERIFKTLVFCLAAVLFTACSSDDEVVTGDPNKIYRESLAEQNLMRAIAMLDSAVEGYFETGSVKMYRYYNPLTGGRSNNDPGSIWMYTASIEAVNAVMHALKEYKDAGHPELYNEHFDRYAEFLKRLYAGAGYFRGTYANFRSYTRSSHTWYTYGVNRGDVIDGNNVSNELTVYDDQMWLIREFLEAYKLTGDKEYLERAEYLTEYCLDGWDCTLDSEGKENGGITWGPSYVTKHSCSNGPFISPLVWLHELYKGSNDETTYYYIGGSNNRQRLTTQMKKDEYYLMYAKKVYEYQKTHLMRPDGVYDDMMGGCHHTSCDIASELVGLTRYRAHTALPDRNGPAYPYNSGTMISGAMDLYRVTGDNVYMSDLQALTDDSFRYFFTEDPEKGYYTYDIWDEFGPWFMNVLMRSYVDAYSVYEGAAYTVDSFQVNLDYAYDNYAHKGMIPTNWWIGWNRDSGSNDTEALFSFGFVSEYAALARYEIAKK